MQGICGKLVDEMDGVLGCALVDWVTGLPIASDIKPRTIITEDAMMALFSAAVSYFSESSVIPQTNPNSGGSGSPVWEIQTTTKYTFHFMAQVPGAEQMLLVLVVDRKLSSLGLGWMAMRQAINRVRNAEAETRLEHPAKQHPSVAARATAYSPDVKPEREPQFRGRRAGAHRTVWRR